MILQRVQSLPNGTVLSPSVWVFTKIPLGKDHNPYYYRACPTLMPIVDLVHLDPFS
jgi:hypothetical protein